MMNSKMPSPNERENVKMGQKCFRFVCSFRRSCTMPKRYSMFYFLVVVVVVYFSVFRSNCWPARTRLSFRVGQVEIWVAATLWPPIQTILDDVIPHCVETARGTIHPPSIGYCHDLFDCVVELFCIPF